MVIFGLMVWSYSNNNLVIWFVFFRSSDLGLMTLSHTEAFALIFVGGNEMGVQKSTDLLKWEIFFENYDT